MSCTLVKRFRVRRERVLVLLPASSDSTLVVEDVRERAGDIKGMGYRCGRKRETAGGVMGRERLI